MSFSYPGLLALRIHTDIRTPQANESQPPLDNAGCKEASHLSSSSAARPAAWSVQVAQDCICLGVEIPEEPTPTAQLSAA